MRYRERKKGWKRILGEDVLSVLLSLVLLIGILAILTQQPLKERELAKQKALETTGFAIATYAEHIATLLLKADTTASIIARDQSAADPSDLFATQIETAIKNDRNLNGYMQLDASGAVIGNFTMPDFDPQSLPIAKILARHRDDWIEPSFQSSDNLGLRAGYLAIERGVWGADGDFRGVAIVFMQLASPYEDSPLEKFLNGSRIRVTTINNQNLFTERNATHLFDAAWLSDLEEEAFWMVYQGSQPIDANLTTLSGELVLAKRSLPGLPVTLFMQVPLERFLDNYWTTRQTTIVTSVIIVAITLFLLLQILIDRQSKHRDEMKRRELDKRLQFSLNATGQGLWDWDFATNEGYFSDNLFALLSMPHGEVAMTFASFRNRIHPDDREQFDHAIDEHVFGQEPLFETEVRMRGPNDDEWTWFSHSGSVVEWSDDDQPARIIGLIKNVHNQKLKRLELEFEASHDPLTGLLNRAAYEDCSARLLAQSRRTGMPLTTIMLDIDHFKRINDTYGHKCGDIVLQNISTLVNSVLRFEEEKMFFRLGGEEFVLLLSHSTAEDGAVLAERIRTKIEGAVIQAGRHKIKITISAGVAQNVDNETAVDTLHRADWALYDAKESGRNRVCVASNNLNCQALTRREFAPHDNRPVANAPAVPRDGPASVSKRQDA
ncbi:sensor domain-containing diguanylate cyclase [Thalassospira sp. MA62]|nr:sensor domain-containing diguanylate cyclase [Thalassospira sp. MA62]